MSKQTGMWKLYLENKQMQFLHLNTGAEHRQTDRQIDIDGKIRNGG